MVNTPSSHKGKNTLYTITNISVILYFKRKHKVFCKKEEIIFMRAKGSTFHLTMLILGVVGAVASITVIIFSLIGVLMVKNAK